MAKKSNSSNHCSFCGRSEQEVNLLISGMTGYICDMCAEQAHAIVDETFKGNKKNDLGINLSRYPPAQIKEFRSVRNPPGECKTFSSVAVYNHYKRILQRI